jgi:uncharacterized protein (TIGR03083 family)
MPVNGSPDRGHRAAGRPKPAPGTRETVLSAALARRPAAIPAAVAPYAVQVRRLDDVLAVLDAAAWARPVIHGWSTERVVAHLHALDRTLAIELGVTVPEGPRTGTAAEPAVLAWRQQTEALVGHMAAGLTRLDDEVRFLGGVMPVRTALLQRAFETWIHADDIRLALLSATHPPPPEHLTVLSDAGVRLLVTTLGVARPRHAGRTVRIHLAGEGGGCWTLPAAGGPASGPPDVTLHAEVLDFCYLMGGRRDPQRIPHQAVGDAHLAADLLEVAAGFDRDAELDLEA